MLKQLIEQKILDILSEGSEHQEVINHHDEMADDHNKEWHRAIRKLENRNLSNSESDRLRRKRDAHQEGYMHHISARNFWKKGNVEKGKELSTRADKFDEDMIAKGHI